MRNKTKAVKHNLYVIQKLYLREHTGAAAVFSSGGNYSACSDNYRLNTATSSYSPCTFSLLELSQYNCTRI